MARIVPEAVPNPEAMRAAGSRVHQAELASLLMLQRDLPASWVVFHGLHWSRVEGKTTVFGEIDFLILNPYGRLIAIEQKNGNILETRDDLKKNYVNGQRSIRAQVLRNINELHSRFSRSYPNRYLDLDYLVYLPDHRVAPGHGLGVEHVRVMDASDTRTLAERVETLMASRPVAQGRSVGSVKRLAADFEQVHQFLTDALHVVPDVGVLGQQVGVMSHKASSELATWVQRLSMNPFRLRIEGTAGSGKTQLALAELSRARALGQTALYLCYNRPLAESMRQISGQPERCRTVYELARDVAELVGFERDFSTRGVFGEMADVLVQCIWRDESLRAMVDVLIIDEGQDFEARWGEALLMLLKPGGRALWLEDSSQRLYDREPMDLSGWVSLQAPVNYRSPRLVVSLINALRLVDPPTQTASVLEGFDPHLLAYRGDPEVATVRAVQDLLVRGFELDRMAVLSFAGLKASTLLARDRWGGFSIRRPLGYAPDGRARWSEGELLADSVKRFKGRAADALVITEVDFAQWDDAIARRLFVGLTRTRLEVVIVASQQGYRCLMERLQEAHQACASSSSS